MRILIVDDERNIREMLSRHLKMNGHQMLEAEHGLAALSLMKRHKVDLIISDINMPVLDGVALMKRVGLLYPTTHMIIITGYVTLANVLSCIRYGAETCIFKPIDDFSLIDNAVERVAEDINRWVNILNEVARMAPEGNLSGGLKDAG